MQTKLLSIIKIYQNHISGSLMNHGAWALLLEGWIFPGTAYTNDLTVLCPFFCIAGICPELKQCVNLQGFRQTDPDYSWGLMTASNSPRGCSWDPDGRNPPPKTHQIYSNIIKLWNMQDPNLFSILHPSSCHLKHLQTVKLSADAGSCGVIEIVKKTLELKFLKPS